MAFQKKDKDRENATDDARASGSCLSSTMKLPVEEFTSPESTMSLMIRQAEDTRPYSLSITSDTYEIGRRSDADITIIQPGVSRHHAKLFKSHSEEIIEDLDSTNGTYVNGVRISRCVLQNNDVIRIGDATLLFTREIIEAKKS